MESLVTLIAAGNLPHLIFTPPSDSNIPVLSTAHRFAYSLLIRVTAFIALLVAGLWSALIATAWRNKGKVGIAWVLFRYYWTFLWLLWVAMGTLSTVVWKSFLLFFNATDETIHLAYLNFVYRFRHLTWDGHPDSKSAFTLTPSRLTVFWVPFNRLVYNLCHSPLFNFAISARSRGWNIPNPRLSSIPLTLHCEQLGYGQVEDFDEAVESVVYEGTGRNNDWELWADGDVPEAFKPFLIAIILGRLVSLCRFSYLGLAILPFFLAGFAWLLVIIFFLSVGYNILLIKLEILTYVCTCFVTVCVLPDVVLDATLHFSWKWTYGLWFSQLGMWPFSISGWRKVYSMCKMLGLSLVLTGLNQVVQYTNHKKETLTGNKAGNLFQTKSRVSARFNSSWTALQKTIAAFNLPSFVRRAQLPLSIDGLQQTFKELKDLGWPVNVSVGQWQQGDYDSLFPDWQFGSIDFKQGMRQLAMYNDVQLEEMAATANVTYKRVEQYQSYLAELKSTSRYFNNIEYAFPDLQLDDMWELVGTIFHESRLTPFDLVISNWEKAYGLGVFAKVTDPRTGKERKMSRREFINSIGLKSFKQLWARTFSLAPTMVPIAPVSVKREALPPKKWLFEKVRTIIGAPITHAISSYIFNYGPNHNFGYRDTPIKIGMPLTGYGLGEVWRRHSFKDVHYAGDCSEFDSTLSGAVLDMIAKIRKKGYERHKDFNDIADLIDREYKNLPNQLLGLTSRGAIYRKGTGLSTGHTSTSMDNSLAMTMLYLMAWKQLTGLSAKEFKLYVELSVYGDDHLISWRLDSPLGWTFANIQKVMKSWGITNNLEAHGPLSKLEFLSKFGCRPSPTHEAELRSAGVQVPDWIVYHNRDKLIGKLTAPVKSRDLAYQAKRLKGYLYLTAHHRDIYVSIVAAIDAKARAILKRDPTYKLDIPSYETVLKAWYDDRNVKSPGCLDPDDPKAASELRDEDLVFSYGEVTSFDAVVNFLANVVDVLNPDVYNSGLAVFLQRPLKRHLEWTIRFTRMANEARSERHVAQLVQKSAYDWVTNDMEMPVAVPSIFATSYLVKHWAFMALTTSKVVSPFSNVTWLDKKLGDLKYLAFGHIDLVVRRIDVPILKIVVASLLGMLPDIPLPDYREMPGYSQLSLMSFGAVIDILFGLAANLFFGKVVPPSFVSVWNAVEQMREGEPVLVKAGTGTGKTTAMAHLLTTSPRFNVVVFVVPRSAIVYGVVPYMDGRYSGLRVTGATQGFIYQPDCQLVYMTPMELLLHPEFLGRADVCFVLDECHVQEPLHQFAWQIIREQPWAILTSATPTQAQMDQFLTVEVTGANVWVKEFVNIPTLLSSPSYQNVVHLRERATDYHSHMTAYFAFVTRYLSFANPYARSLVFVNTKAEALQMAARLNAAPGPEGIYRSASLLDSEHKVVDMTANVIVATSVADVGITIPDVDHVFTTDTCISVRTHPETGKTKVEFCRAPDSLVTQRAGRTGRTNNGRVLIWPIPGCHDLEPLSNHEIASTLLASGVSMPTLVENWPSLVQSLFDPEPFDRERFLEGWANMKAARLDEVMKWYTEHPFERPPVMKVAVDVTAELTLVEAEADNTLQPAISLKHLGGGVNWSIANELSLALSAAVSWAKSGLFYSPPELWNEVEHPETLADLAREGPARLASAVVAMMDEERIEEEEMEVVDEADNMYDDYKALLAEVEDLRLRLVQAQAAKAALGEYNPLKLRGWNEHFRIISDVTAFFEWVEEFQPDDWLTLLQLYGRSENFSIHDLFTHPDSKPLARSLYAEWREFATD